jgi:Zn-dependent metalloprotease
MDSKNSAPGSRKALLWVIGFTVFVLAIYLIFTFFLKPKPSTTPQETPPVSSPMKESPQMKSLRALEAASGVKPYTYFRNGFPRFIEAPVEVAGNNAVERAEAYLSDYAALYRQDDPYLAHVVERYLPNDLDEAVIFNQTYQGIPVYAGQIIVHVNGSKVINTQGAFMLPTDLDVTPFIESWQAETIVAKNLQAPEDVDWKRAPTRLEVFDPSLIKDEIADPRLVWHVFVAGPGDEDMLIDAKTGEILLAVQNNHGDGGPLNGYKLDLETANQNWGNYCYYDTTDDDWIGDESGLINDYLHDRDAVAVWWLLRDVYTAFHTNFNFQSIDGSSSEIEAYVHAGGDVIRGCASFRPGCGILEFSDGCISPDIVGHEYTHGINNHNSRFVYCDQSGAIDEGLADIMSVLVDGTWIIGDGKVDGTAAFRNPETGTGIAMRMTDRNTSGSCESENNSDNVHVHFNSGVISRAAFLLAMGGNQDGYTITGIGNSKTLALFWGLLRHPLSTNATFQEARNQAVSIAARWASNGTSGFSSNDLCQVRNAFAAVGLPQGDRDCDGNENNTDPDQDGDGIPDTSDNCPFIPNPEQVDNDHDFIPGYSHFERGGDVCDADDDNDGVGDARDNCQFVSNTHQEDSDHDNIGDACEDDDNDGIVNALDNCVSVANHDQRDTDHDLTGDACDTDDDNDGIPDVRDNCMRTSNSDQADADKDGIGDACDNCPAIANADQMNRDRDKLGDACDPDIDGDGIPNDEDDCPVSEQFCLRGNMIGLPTGLPITNIIRFPLNPPECPTCHITQGVWDPKFCSGLVIDRLPGLLYWLSDDFGNRINESSRDETQSVFNFVPLSDHQYFLNIGYKPDTELEPGTGVSFKMFDSLCAGMPRLNFPLAGATEPPSIQALFPLAPTDTPTFFVPGIYDITGTPTLTQTCTPKPQSTTAVPPPCASYKMDIACKNGGCYWWSNNTCNANPEPPPGCSVYDNGLDCTNAKCFWWGAGCHDTSDPCSSNADEKSCFDAKCTWDPKNNTCNTP